MIAAVGRRRANRCSARSLRDAGLNVDGRPDIVGACDRAAAVLDAGPVAVSHDLYRTLIDDMRAAGAAPNLVRFVSWLIDEAEHYDRHTGPILAASAEMAPVFGVDPGPKLAAAAKVRAAIAELLILAAKWPQKMTD